MKKRPTQISDLTDLRTLLRDLAYEVGFDVVGFCKADLSQDVQENLVSFVEADFHGTMEWMETTLERRRHPQNLWEEARSVIVLGMNYGLREDPMALLDQPDRGVISCYAKNRDYHDTVKKRLKRMAREMVSRWGGELKVFVDTAPVMEKPLAAQSALGWQGKHTCVVSRDFGSWLFLGEIYTTLEIEPDTPSRDHCGRCQNCLDICPTDAFTESGKIDARKCISYLTIEHDGMIDPDLASKMGNRIYGCDDCLAVCPWNKFSTPTPHKDFKPRVEFTAPRLSDLLDLDEESFRQFFTGSPIKRIKRHRLLRNVLIAVANGRLTNLRAKVERLTRDDHPVIAQTAIRTLSILNKET